jgi:hypothetical protein
MLLFLATWPASALSREVLPLPEGPSIAVSLINEHKLKGRRGGSSGREGREVGRGLHAAARGTSARMQFSDEPLPLLSRLAHDESPPIAHLPALAIPLHAERIFFCCPPFRSSVQVIADHSRETPGTIESRRSTLLLLDSRLHFLLRFSALEPLMVPSTQAKGKPTCGATMHAAPSRNVQGAILLAACASLR